MDGHGTKCRRKIAEIYSRLSRVHEGGCTSVTDRQTDRRTGDSIANMNVSSRSLKTASVLTNCSAHFANYEQPDWAD